MNKKTQHSNFEPYYLLIDSWHLICEGGIQRESCTINKKNIALLTIMMADYVLFSIVVCLTGEYNDETLTKCK